MPETIIVSEQGYHLNTWLSTRFLHLPPTLINWMQSHQIVQSADHSGDCLISYRARSRMLLLDVLYRLYVKDMASTTCEQWFIDTTQVSYSNPNTRYQTLQLSKIQTHGHDYICTSPQNIHAFNSHVFVIGSLKETNVSKVLIVVYCQKRSKHNSSYTYF